MGTLAGSWGAVLWAELAVSCLEGSAVGTVTGSHLLMAAWG